MNEVHFFQELAELMKRAPVLEREVYKKGDINLYIKENINRFLKIAGENKVGFNAVALFAGDEIIKLIRKEELEKELGLELILNLGQAFSGNLDTYWLMIEAKIKDGSLTSGRFLTFFGIAMDRKISEKYFQTRWTLQINDGMRAEDADRAARVL